MDQSVGTSLTEAPSDGFGSHVPERCKAGLAVANANKPLANCNHDEVLGRLRAGESPSQLAKSLGISHQAVYEWLIAHYPEQWMAISASKSLARIETAETSLDAETIDQVGISRARESARLAQWTLERTAKRLYGDAKEGGGTVVNVLVQRDGVTVNTFENEQ